MPLRSQVLGGLRAAVYWRAERASHDLRMRYRRSGKYAPGPNRAELHQSRLSVSAQSLSATPEESNTLYLSGSWPVTSKLVCALGPQEMSSSDVVISAAFAWQGHALPWPHGSCAKANCGNVGGADHQCRLLRRSPRSQWHSGQAQFGVATTWQRDVPSGR